MQIRVTMRLLWGDFVMQQLFITVAEDALFAVLSFI